MSSYLQCAHLNLDQYKAHRIFLLSIISPISFFFSCKLFDNETQFLSRVFFTVCILLIASPVALFNRFPCLYIFYKLVFWQDYFTGSVCALLSSSTWCHVESNLCFYLNKVKNVINIQLFESFLTLRNGGWVIFHIFNCLRNLAKATFSKELSFL